MTVAAIRAARQRAEALMVDACVITKPGEGEPVFDESTGKYVDPDRVTVYEGRCRLQVRGGGTRTTPEAGGRDWVVQQSVLQLPVAGSEDVRPGHLVEMTASANDAGVVGRKFDVDRWQAKTHATKRELALTEGTG